MHAILVIRLSSLGDVVLATPLVRQLARTYPDAVIDVAVAERFAAVWQYNPYVRRVWAVPPGRPDAASDALKLSMLESLPLGTYDGIVDLQHNVRSRMLRKGLGHTVGVAPKHRLEKLAMVWLKRKPAVVTPIGARYRAAAAGLPLVFDTDGPEVWLEEEAARGYYLPVHRQVPRRRRIAIAVGARHATKQWPVDRFAALCRTLVDDHGITPVLVGGADDVATATAVAAAVGGGVERADGSTSVHTTCRILDGCDAIVTNDTGVMHLAAARRLPTVAIFGSTVPELGFAPVGTPHVIVQQDVACRPCSHIGRTTCPRGHFLCMTAIQPPRVIQALYGLGAIG